MIYLSQNDYNKLLNTDCEFVSLKYIDTENKLVHIDFQKKNLSKVCEVNNTPSLVLINKKDFIDPFRSHSVHNFFCYDKNTQEHSRQKLSKHYEDSVFTAEISAWNKNEDNCCQHGLANIDANLRSEILNILEEININTKLHKQGLNFGENIISVSCTNLLDLTDNILICRYVIYNCFISYGRDVELFKKGCNNLSITHNDTSKRITMNNGNLNSPVKDLLSINFKKFLQND